MNHAQRRAAKARARRMRRHDRFYRKYIRHLPQVSVDEALSSGGLFHLAFHHDAWCRFYDHGSLADCNCSPDITCHADPVRS